jgi:preprotein translocase subunit SecE
MALIDCPECGKQISSAAAACPKCGFPDPSKNKDAVTTGTFKPPQLPKEDISTEFPLIPINASDSTEAAKQIVQYLNQFRRDGWVTGDAVAGADGINRYYIENATKKGVLQFDMRPTTGRGVSPTAISMHTLLAASAGLTEEKLNQLKKRHDETMRIFYPRERPTWQKILLVLGVGIVVFFVALIAFLH